MDLVTKQGYCYNWNQTIAKRGSSEIGSCIYHYLIDDVKSTDVSTVILFSDNCPGPKQKPNDKPNAFFSNN